MAEETVQNQLDELRKQNEALKAIVESKDFNPVQQTLGNLVELVLGNKFPWRVLGFGQFQTLELEVPDDLADPKTSYEANKLFEDEYEREDNGSLKRDAQGKTILTGKKKEKDGRLRFYKTHPKAGQVCGDVRHCRIKDEEQIKQWLTMVKNEIIKRKQGEGQTAEFN